MVLFVSRWGVNLCNFKHWDESHVLWRHMRDVTHLPWVTVIISFATHFFFLVKTSRWMLAYKWGLSKLKGTSCYCLGDQIIVRRWLQGTSRLVGCSCYILTSVTFRLFWLRLSQVPFTPYLPDISWFLILHLQPWSNMFSYAVCNDPFSYFIWKCVLWSGKVLRSLTKVTSVLAYWILGVLCCKWLIVLIPAFCCF